VTFGIHHIAAETYHGRRGAIRNAFRYTIDYVLTDAEAEVPTPALFARNRANLMSLHDKDHGGKPHHGKGAVWLRAMLAAHDVTDAQRIELLAQPRVLGHVFNPVSFWLCYDADDALTTVVAEVTNTFGDRHSYVCRHPDGRPITREETLSAQKLMHVSPFQPVEGGYRFRFDIQPHSIGIWIDYARGNDGVIATLTGPRKPITNRAIIKAVLRRPFGSRRVLALIHWQALRLWFKGATFRARPEPPSKEVSR